MKYTIFSYLDVTEKEARAKLVEEAFQDKFAPIPIEGLRLNFEDGIKAFLLEREYIGKAKKVHVDFVKDYEGEINFETDVCGYLTLNGYQYYAWAKGFFQETDEEISLILQVSWDDNNAQ